jgi:hypothetical protein
VLCQTCVLDPVESAGYVVHSDALGAQNVNALFFMLSWDWYDSTKCASGQVTPNMCIRIWGDLRVTWCIPVLPGRETSTQYFPCKCGPGADSTKSVPGHVMPDFCFFCI